MVHDSAMKNQFAAVAEAKRVFVQQLDHSSCKDALQERWLQVSAAPRQPARLSHSGKSSWQLTEGKGSPSQPAAERC